MKPEDLDASYTALCKALGKVGQDNANLFLAMLSLSLISQSDAPDKVLQMIAEAQSQCLPPTAIAAN